MNPIHVLRDYVQTTPFHPFEIRLSDGRAFRINHPDYVTFTGRGRVIVEGDTDDVYATVSPLHITSVERIRESA